MAFGCQHYIVEFEVSIDDPVLVQKLQDQADLSSVESRLRVSIGEFWQAELVDFFQAFARKLFKWQAFEGIRAYFVLVTLNFASLI